MKKGSTVVTVACVAAVASVALLGCSDVRITGELDGRVLRATGTVAAWIDSTSFEDQDDGTAKRVNRPSDTTRLHLEFFEPVFDPTVDFGSLPAGERLALADEISRGDRLSVSILRGEAARAGDEIKSLPKEGLPPEVLPFVDFTRISLADKPSADATYPDEVARPGSDITTVFAVDETTPELVGTLSIEVAAEADEKKALEGEVLVEFGAELLPERIAECNFDRFGQGAIDACTLLPFAGGVAGPLP